MGYMMEEVAKGNERETGAQGREDKPHLEP